MLAPHCSAAAADDTRRAYRKSADAATRKRNKKTDTIVECLFSIPNRSSRATTYRIVFQLRNLIGHDEQLRFLVGHDLHEIGVLLLHQFAGHFEVLRLFDQLVVEADELRFQLERGHTRRECRRMC